MATPFKDSNKVSPATPKSFLKKAKKIQTLGAEAGFRAGRGGIPLRELSHSNNWLF
jgi:hypothetical protein